MEAKINSSLSADDEELAVSLLEECDSAYLTGTALLTDAVYDTLREAVEGKWPNNEYFSRLTDLEGTVPHEFIINSLRKPKIGAVYKWFESRPTGTKFIIMEKIDGMSLVMRYDGRKMIYALTRGKDGTNGRDVLRVVRQFVKELPTGFAGEVVVRGEVVYVGKVGDGTPYTDSRAATVGIMKSGENASQLRFIAHELIVYNGPLNIDTTHIVESLTFLKDGMGFETVPFEDFPRIESQNKEATLKRVLDEFIDRHAHPEYLIDGCVICPTIYIRENMMKPLNKIAYKNPKCEGITTVIGMQVNVGRSGKLTPVLLVEPIQLGGSIVHRVTGANFDIITRKQIGIGTKLSLQLNVIPVILGAKSPDDHEIFTVPDTCPVCDSEVVDEKCTNPGCKASSEARICHFLAKIGVKQFGEKRVQLLAIDTIPDLYTLSPSRLKNIPRFGAQLAETFYTNIREQIINIAPSTYLAALGISSFGVRASEKMLKNISIEEFLAAESFDDISERLDLHVDSMRSVEEKFDEIKDITATLRHFGLTFKQAQPEDGADDESAPTSAVRGKNFVVSGKPTSHWDSQEEVEDLIRANGGNIKTAVSRSTNYLVASAESKTAKAKKANELGVARLTFEEFFEMID